MDRVIPASLARLPVSLTSSIVNDRLPPMQALLTFESAARLKSFTAAGRELGTTQPAVSQRIVQLETDLNAPLFARGHRGVMLTPEGEHLYETVRKSLDTIRATTSAIRRDRATAGLTILTDPGFAAFWLVPRLATLYSFMPDVNIQVVTSQTVFDPRHDRTDVAITFGDGNWRPCTSTKLFPEEVTAVCSPEFRDANRDVTSASALGSLPLLHVQPTESAPWLAWDSWFTAQGLPPLEGTRSVTFNSYSLVIQGALMGHGVALGWRPLVDELVDKGLLVRLLDTSVVTECGYFLVRQPARPESPAIQRFRQWLFSQCRMAS